MVKADPFVGQGSGEEINFSLFDQAERVFNFGAGPEVKLKDALSLYASYSSDYSYVPADITLRSTYAWARESIPRPIDFPDEGEDKGIFDSDDTADVMWSRWRFIFSFSVPFLKDVQKSIEDKFSGD